MWGNQSNSAGGGFGGGGGGAMGMQQAATFTDQHDAEVPISVTQESISCLKFAPLNQVYSGFGTPILAAAFWDGHVIIYQINLGPMDAPQTNQTLQQNLNTPILGLCWCVDQPALLLACADNSIKKWDLQANQVGAIGGHSQPVKDIYCFVQNGTSFVVSGGWDSRVKFWTWASPTQLNPIGEVYLGKPIHYMSGEFPLLVTAHSELFIHYWNLNSIFQNNFSPQGMTTSPLKCATTCIACFPDAKGYAIASIEGRCGIKYIDLQKNQINLTDDFCFKCHRQDDTTASSKPSSVYTVNGIAFNKQFGTFVTYGQDGCYFVWNKDTKSKLKNNKPAPWPVTAADFLENGTLLAVAYGYDWGKGAEESKKGYPVKLFVRKVKEEEVFKKPTK